MSGANGRADPREVSAANHSALISDLPIQLADSRFPLEKINELVSELEVPFDESFVDWRVTNTAKGEQRGQVVPYANATNALVGQIEAMAEPLGRRLYRGILKTVARAWNPSEIREADVLSRVLAQMQSAERGLRRLEAALNRIGPEAVVPTLRSLRLNSLEQVDTLESLKKVVLAAEEAAGLTH